EVVLVAAVGVAGGVRVVLEEKDVARDPVLVQVRLGLVPEVLDEALTGLVVAHQLGDVVALGRRVLGVESRVQIQPGAVLEEHVGVTGARDHSLEEVASDVVGGQAALAVEHTGEAVLVLEPEDPALHGGCSRSRFVSTASNGQQLELRVVSPASSRSGAERAAAPSPDLP